MISLHPVTGPPLYCLLTPPKPRLHTNLVTLLLAPWCISSELSQLLALRLLHPSLLIHAAGGTADVAQSSTACHATAQHGLRYISLVLLLLLCVSCRRGGIMLTTYGMVLHNATQLMSGRGSAVARGGPAGAPSTSMRPVTAVH
jgi:hypothetical protein